MVKYKEVWRIKAETSSFCQVRQPSFCRGEIGREQKTADQEIQRTTIFELQISQYQVIKNP
jgi:hypothetical protein